MRSFWALPAVLRLALASAHSFSVFDDLLAYPQYEVVWPEAFVTEHDAAALLASRDASASQDLAQRDATVNVEDEAQQHTYEAVVLHGHKYLCSIPVVPDEPEVNGTAPAEESRAEEEKELVRAADRGGELLEGMRGQCIYYISGWWSYSFCYRDEVRQFHQLPPGRGVPIYPPVEDTSVHSFVLGRHPTDPKAANGNAEPKTLAGDLQQGPEDQQQHDQQQEQPPAPLDDEGNPTPSPQTALTLARPRLETKGSTRYMTQRLTSGTICDLTGLPRKIDVQFHCNPASSDRIAMIKETSTCSYLMLIDTPRLCHDVAFLPPQDNAAHAVACRPVVPERDVAGESWDGAKLGAQIRDARALGADLAAAADAPPHSHPDPDPNNPAIGAVVGGIRIGAHLHVGSTPATTLEKTVIAGGGKEIHVGTLASSSGPTMSVAEMKKLGVTNPQDVEKLKRNLERIAGEGGWELNLVDTPRGREFRGVVETEEGGEKGSKKGENAAKGNAGKQGGAKAEKGERNGGAGTGEGKRKERSGEGEEGSEEVYKDEL